MKKQRVIFWTGQQPDALKGCEGKAESLPLLPEPTPLHHAALIKYQWGRTQFEILACACTIRTTPWGNEQMTWLHCKAWPRAETKPGELTGVINVLIPAHYVTAIQPGPAFREAGYKETEEIDLGVFPPNQAVPANPLPLEMIERVIVDLLTPVRN